MDSHALALIGITLFAATVNGALGYGFSSLTVPVALLFLTNRVLNPALVPIEVVLNALRALGESRVDSECLASRDADRHCAGRRASWSGRRSWRWSIRTG
jgi:hypothetical protein